MDPQHPTTPVRSFKLTEKAGLFGALAMTVLGILMALLNSPLAHSSCGWMVVGILLILIGVHLVIRLMARRRRRKWIVLAAFALVVGLLGWEVLVAVNPSAGRDAEVVAVERTIRDLYDKDVAANDGRLPCRTYLIERWWPSIGGSDLQNRLSDLGVVVLTDDAHVRPVDNGDEPGPRPIYGWPPGGTYRHEETGDEVRVIQCRFWGSTRYAKVKVEHTYGTVIYTVYSWPGGQWRIIGKRDADASSEHPATQ